MSAGKKQKWVPGSQVPQQRVQRATYKKLKKEDKGGFFMTQVNKKGDFNDDEGDHAHQDSIEDF